MITLLRLDETEDPPAAAIYPVSELHVHGTLGVRPGHAIVLADATRLGTSWLRLSEQSHVTRSTVLEANGSEECPSPFLISFEAGETRSTLTYKGMED